MNEFRGKNPGGEKTEKYDTVISRNSRMMNTPTHLLVTLATAKPLKAWHMVSALIIGALIPDIAMYVMYIYDRFILGIPESVIWNERYFGVVWQTPMRIANSIPIMLLIMGVAWWRGWKWLVYCMYAALLHIALDLPLHQEDAHQHLYPLSSWEFHSPVSYWNPAAGGLYILGLEVVMMILSAVIIWRNAPQR